MTGSSISRLEVFDFKEEDEVPDFVSSRFLAKLKNPSANELLECVARGNNFRKEEIGDIPCIDVEENDGDDGCENSCLVNHVMLEKGNPSEDDNSGLDVVPPCRPTSQKQHHFGSVHSSQSLSPEQEVKTSSAGELAHATSQLNCAVPESPSSNESIDMVPAADEGMKDSSSSPSTSDFAENGVLFNECTSKLCFGSWEMENLNREVVVSPDFVVYQDKFWKHAFITFSSSSIQLMGSSTHGNQEVINTQWEINDIIDIESQWCGKVEAAMIKLHLISKDVEQADGVLSTSGVEELTFGVVDRGWLEQQEKIASLDLRYKDKWKIAHDTDMVLDGDALFGQNSNLFQKRYFPNFDEPFEDFVYAKEDSDSVSIRKSDVDVLQPETFLNDTIIEFYIKYLKNKIPSEQKHRFYFFNTFFFSKLADLDKDPFNASEGRAAYLRVRKWTKKVNLFEKDYIFIPVNFNLHWSLIVICHPGEVANFTGKIVEKATKVPCILHMNSIQGTHAGLKNHVQSYLWEEWKEKQNEASESIASNFLNLRFLALELPQQENSYDCGMFLLHYVELFLDQAPENFNPLKITKWSNFLTADWFPPADVSIKRVFIQRLIYELLEKNSLPACNHDNQPSEFVEHSKDDDGDVEVIAGKCSPRKSCNQNLLSYQAGRGFDMTTFSMRSSLLADDSGMVLREFFESGANTESLTNGQHQHFAHSTSYCQLKDGAMAMMQEDTETGEQFLYTPSSGNRSQPMAGFTPSVPFSSSDFGAETSWIAGTSVQSGGEDTEDLDDLSSETSSCESDDSLEVGIIENSSFHLATGPCLQTDRQIFPFAADNGDLSESLTYTSTKMLETSGIGNLPNHNEGNDCIENGDSLLSCLVNKLELMHENSDAKEKWDLSCNVENVDDEDEPVSDQERVAKRPQPSSPLIDMPNFKEGNDCIENDDSLLSRQKNEPELIHEDSEAEEKWDIPCDVQNVDDKDEHVSDQEQVSKRSHPPSSLIDSPSHNKGNDIENDDSLMSQQGNEPELIHENSDAEETWDFSCNVQNVNGEDELVSDQERVAKRLRPSSPLIEEGRNIAGSPSKDLHV